MADYSGPRETPPGSGLWGTPVLADWRRHLTTYSRGTWTTLCGKDVPIDHQCPSPHRVRQIGEPRSCRDCMIQYRLDRGEAHLAEMWLGA